MGRLRNPAKSKPAGADEGSRLRKPETTDLYADTPSEPAGRTAPPAPVLEDIRPAYFATTQTRAAADPST